MQNRLGCPGRGRDACMDKSMKGGGEGRGAGWVVKSKGTAVTVERESQVSQWIQASKCGGRDRGRGCGLHRKNWLPDAEKGRVAAAASSGPQQAAVLAPLLVVAVVAARPLPAAGERAVAGKVRRGVQVW